MRADINNSKSPNGVVAALSAGHLLHPAEHFGHPRDVLAADDIGDDEKHATPASWASDIFAIESIPALRLYPATDKAVSYNEIIEALKTLDKHDRQSGEQESSRSFDIHRACSRRSQARRIGGLGLCS
ncbi:MULTISPECIES: hypothetical protein [unclassified Rhizobium]|uniref:hypothetical protein n=1 Tax=unclassified Rhizobium TaxID=2613769 RepID=UPI0038101148